MKVRNIVRKAAVLGSSAALVGTTLMGALAYDLADYPAKYIVDGQFDGTIVVGANAEVADVLGSIDIAASLQASAVTEEEIEVEGSVGEVQLEGDAFRFETSSDLLELREPMGSVYDTLTDSELEALGGGSITTDQGSTDYNQYVRFGDNAASALQRIAVNYNEDEDDKLGNYLIIDDDEPFFEWEIEFTEGLESETTGGELDDLEDETFNIFGTPFTFVDSTVDTTGATTVTIEFMAGQVADTLREGETRTYSIDGVDYEVTLVFVSDPNSGTAEAKFSVNGELTDALTDGDTDTLSGGLQVGVRDLLVNSREGVVSFFLGADKVEFADTTVGTADNSGGSVEISNENIEDSELDIVGSMTQADNSTFELTSIKYRLSSDATVGSTIYVPAGKGVREFLDEPEGMLSPTFDLRYEGLKVVPTNAISLQAQGDHSYDMSLTNIRGKTFDFPFATNQSGAGGFSFGDKDDDFWFTEEDTTAVGTLNDTDSDFFVSDDDYFVLSEAAVGSADEKTDSAVLRYEDIDTSDKILTFTDMSSGESKEVSYQDYSSGDAIGRATNFVVEGNSYTVYVGPAAGTNGDYALAIDLTGDGNVDGAEAGFTVKGGGVLNFGTQSAALVGAGSIVQTLTTPTSQFDGSAGSDVSTWTISGRANNEIGLAFTSYLGPNNVTGTAWGEFEMVSDDSNDDYDRGMTDYGAIVELYDPSGSDQAEELTITYPEEQIGAQVFVIAGTVEASSTSGSGYTRSVVNPIAVGLAVMDKDAPAIGSDNLIVVGGPCANTVAAELMNNPEQCTEGFEEGKAFIKSFENSGKVAILVAGFSAQDTTGAARVLANYGDYPEFSGSEVEVVVADLNSIDVNPMG